MALKTIPFSQSFCRYWRNSLADAGFQTGAFSDKDAERMISLAVTDAAAGFLPEDVVTQLFGDAGEEIEEVSLRLYPSVFSCAVSHALRTQSGLPTFITPLVMEVQADRSGRLIPGEKVFVPRNLLEPMDSASYAIGEVSDQDDYLTKNRLPPGASGMTPDELWESYRHHAEGLLQFVANDWLSGCSEYVRIDESWIEKQDPSGGASRHIIALYDHMLSHGFHTEALFKTYANPEVSPPKPCLAPNSMFAQRLGHSSDTHPLADAQRDAVAHLIAGDSGDIIGVNGPPGTGKTTMLLSVVATLWVKAVLDGKGEPPIIVAASTNNQAVTNVIDAFGKDFSVGTGEFAGRWLPEIKSFGAYFPARKKESEAARKYQTEAFFQKIEEADYLMAASQDYLLNANRAFKGKSSSVEDVVEHLENLIRLESYRLVYIEDGWSRYQMALAVARNCLGDDPVGTLSALKHELMVAEQAHLECKALKKAWDDYLKEESWFITFFSMFLGGFRKRRLREAINFFEENRPAGCRPFRFETFEALDEFIIREACDTSRIDALIEDVHRAELVVDDLLLKEGEWIRLAQKCKPDASSATTLAEIDAIADVAIRFPMFLMATHYWEGKWILSMRILGKDLNEEKKKSGAHAVTARIRRRMMITPCFVSTFFMLPQLFKVSKKEGRDWFQDYLYSKIDLLIVDEAGQVVPEVAGASFALAKRALVIGDTLQIEPIWAIPKPVDFGNMISGGILPKGARQDEYQRIADLGKSAASGSVMRIAQLATHYHYDKDLPRGMFLYEHRRCYDEIVSYCNDLCYHNKLLPKRGAANSAERELPLPVMGYFDIENGVCSRTNGSRSNTVEAEAIASWLSANRTMLEDFYSQPLQDIVGVVTPFSGQVRSIVTACQKVGISAGSGAGKMTVGTVHSLQGAERRLVIFSPVYTQNANGAFIDQSPSMLNVAVSRAKDSFLVFGEMRTLNAIDARTPRGLLFRHITAGKNSALTQ